MRLYTSINGDRRYVNDTDIARAIGLVPGFVWSVEAVYVEGEGFLALEIEPLVNALRHDAASKADTVFGTFGCRTRQVLASVANDLPVSTGKVLPFRRGARTSIRVRAPPDKK
ncbi:MAG: hypothetical protein ABI421_02795 [Polyangiaceae bacterium]